jgi:diguanylate cyclase (GGDEF)-like protein/PAS domain S-box-containing protein
MTDAADESRGLERLLALCREALAAAAPGDVERRGFVQQLLDEIERLDAHFHKQTQILDQIHESVITMDLEGYITHWNKGAEHLFGYASAEAVGRHILFLYADPDADDSSFDDVFLEHGGREMEVRRRRKDGEVFWASLQLSMMRDAAGMPSGIIGYLTDITERIEAQSDLRLHARIFEHSNEGILITDASEHIVSVNHAFTRITGFSAEEVMGKSPRMLHSGHHDEEFYVEMWRHIEDEGRWQGEIWDRRKGGELYPTWSSISAVKDSTGEVSHYFSIFTDISERKSSEERINHLAYYDALTGLPNRSLFYKLVDQALVEARRARQHGAILFIDLNRFKPINDTLGHNVGDRLLQQIGSRLRETVRSEDVVARLGGDEFVVALFEVAKRDHAGYVAQKLIGAFDLPFIIDNHELKLGAAIGISIYPQDGFETETLLRMADIAMYRAKQTGEDGYAFYSHEMNQKALDRLKLESDLRHAIERNELLLYYQPKVNIASGRIIGCEALVRWRHPEQGMVSPGVFIPVAEETGLVTQLSAWVLEAALSQARDWKAEGLEVTKIAVNLSARDFSLSLPAQVMLALDKHGIGPEWLELEITESMLMHRTDSVIRMMDELARIGIALSLDDFGTGYSSLSYLKRFPIDTLKIDQSFVRGIPDDPNDCAIAGAIVGMAKRLGHNVIAEGVETTAQLLFIKSLGCDELQGYLFSPPVPGETFTAMLREGKTLEI